MGLLISTMDLHLVGFTLILLSTNMNPKNFLMVTLNLHFIGLIQFYGSS